MTALPVKYDIHLKAEYVHLFDTATLAPKWQPLANRIVQKINASKERYSKIAEHVGCPWWFVGLIHYIECGLDFNKHLHNGDSLKARTVRVPKGRPVAGAPPFTFEDSALDALKLKGLDKWRDWSIAGVLWLLEGYNGYGYRQYHPTVKTPYLWSGSQHYVKGKYVADGHFDPDCVSQQLGLALIIKQAQWHV